MKKLLLNDKIPYFLAIFIALASYQVNKVITIQESSPTLVYKFRTLTEEDYGESSVKKELECELKNISYNKVFRNLQFYITYRSERNKTLPEPYHVFDPKVVSVSPAMIWPDTLTENVDSLLNAYIIPAFQPSTHLYLKLVVIENKKIDEYPKIYLNTPIDAVRLLDENIYTLLVENEAFANVFLLLIWLGFITWYIVYIIKHKE